ncbi:MAG: type II secretion system GspH family protein [Planctomycetota bacterium]|nr:type II secretion system GspH family protein [Planctomycetota bacterium]
MPALRPCHRAFTLIEFMVAIGIFGILIAILLPYVISRREMARRTMCEARIGQIGLALLQYAKDNGSKSPLPQTPGDSAKPNGYVAFTGPDDPNPFAKGTAVRSNDITASLWLLERGGYVGNPAIFNCPSTSDEPDDLTDSRGAQVSPLKRSNFRSPGNLSFSYASPFTDAFDFALSSDRLPSGFAVLADKNPGFQCEGLRVVGPPRDAPPFVLATGNSRNHQQAGQNVLHPAGNVSFESTPYCGVSYDNIYTALAPKRLEGAHPVLDAPGYLGPDLGAAYMYDSYLVPTAQDTAPAR